MTNNQKPDNMFSQKAVFGSDEETIHQEQQEKELDVTASSSENLESENLESENSANELQRESLEVLLIGSRKVVTSTIHYLHSMGYIQISDWTPLERCPSHPEKVMSILERKITVR